MADRMHTRVTAVAPYRARAAAWRALRAVAVLVQALLLGLTAVRPAAWPSRSRPRSRSTPAADMPASSSASARRSTPTSAWPTASWSSRFKTQVDVAGRPAADQRVGLCQRRAPRSGRQGGAHRARPQGHGQLDGGRRNGCSSICCPTAGPGRRPACRRRWSRSSPSGRATPRRSSASSARIARARQVPLAARAGRPAADLLALRVRTARADRRSRPSAPRTSSRWCSTACSSSISRRAKATLPPTIESIETVSDEQTASVSFAFIGKVDVRTFREDNNYVVDVMAIDAQAETAAELIPQAADPAAAVRARRPRRRRRPTKPPMTVPASNRANCASRGRLRHRARAAAGGAGACAPPPAGCAAREHAPRPPRAPARPAGRRATGAAGLARAADAGRSPPSADAAGRSWRLRRQGENLKLTFPFAAPTPAAVFRRADTLWLVFDTARQIDLAALAKDGTPHDPQRHGDAVARRTGRAHQARPAAAHRASPRTARPGPSRSATSCSSRRGRSASSATRPARRARPRPFRSTIRAPSIG